MTHKTHIDHTSSLVVFVNWVIELYLEYSELFYIESKAFLFLNHKS